MIIKYAFSGLGRRVSKILRDVDRDYSKRYTTQMRNLKTEDMKQSYIDIQNKDQKLEHLTKPHNFNRVLKQEYNEQIDRAIDIEVERMNREELEDKSLKWLENNYMAGEVKKFEKILFQKSERLRLLKKENQRVENYLPLELLQSKGETEFIELHQQHNKYQSTLNSLQNQRITEMRDGVINPYGDLIKSQLLTQYPNLKTLIEEHLTKIDQSDVNNLVSQLKEQVDTSNSLINWDSVTSFYKGMQKQRENSLVTFSKHSQSVSIIQDYQNYLMDKFYNNSLQMRTRGEIQFADMTEEECVRYIHYDIKDTEILLRLVSTMDLIPEKFTGKISSAILQKIMITEHDNLLLLKDERYRVLLNYIARAEFDDQTLAQTFYALSLLNPRSIQTVYDKLSYHLYDNLSKQLIPRIKQFTTQQYAMICRNFNYLPLAQDLQLQNLMTQEIVKNRINDQLSVFDAESFIHFLSRPLLSDQSLVRTIQNLTHSILNHPKAHLEMDSITLKYISSTILHIEDTKNITQLFKQYASKFQLAIESCQCNSLSQFALALSKMDINRNNILCQNVKSRFIKILTEKQKEQDQQDITVLISSLTQIDIKSIYPTKRVNEILLLQTVFNRFPYGFKSAFHTPYEKLLNVMKNYSKMFTDTNLIIIMHSLLTIGHLHKDAMIEAIQQIKDVQYLFPLYTNMNIMNQILLDQLIHRFEKQQQQITIQGVLYYLQTMFHYNLLKEEDFKYIKLEDIDKLDQTSLCFLTMLISSVQITDQIKNIYRKIKPLLNPQFIEQKYLLLLSRVPCDYEKNELSYILTQLREQTIQKNKEIGIEKYQPNQIIQMVADLYQQNGHKVQKNMQLPLVQADLLIDEKIPIQFISVNEMIDDQGQFDFTGMQRLLKKRTNIKYILYEEFIRSANQLNFIKQLL